MLIHTSITNNLVLFKYRRMCNWYKHWDTPSPFLGVAQKSIQDSPSVIRRLRNR